MVKIVDVAQAAGVSPATVSRVFNSPDIVKADVRKRILEVAAQLNYRPNPAARALRSRRTHIIGAAIPTLDYAVFARMINEFQNVLASHGATTIVLTTGFDNSNAFDKIRLLLDRGAEAILLVGEVQDERLKALIALKTVPFVTTYSTPPNSPCPSVGFDNYRATTQAVQHLIDLGHKEFAMIAATATGNDRQRTRIAAYIDCISKHRANGDDRIFTSSVELAGGGEKMQEIRRHHPQVTAVICNNDVFAIAALRECRKHGLKVPDDISIVGHDDFDFAAFLEPPLTTISVPAREMGAAAAEHLWAALTQNEPVKGLVLPTNLVIRGTTGPPPVR